MPKSPIGVETVGVATHINQPRSWKLVGPENVPKPTIGVETVGVAAHVDQPQTHSWDLKMYHKTTPQRGSTC